MTLKETSSEIYDFPVGEDVDRDLSPNTNLPSPFVVVPPSNFSATEVTTIDADGTVFPAVELTWNSNLTGSISDIEIIYALTSSNDYQVLGKFGRDTTSFTTLDVAAGDTYNFYAKNFNYVGVFSSFVTASLKVLGDTIRPQAPITGSITGGTGSLQINWTNAAVDTDYRFTQVFIGTSAASASAVDQGRVSGTTFNKTITEGGTYYAFLKNIDTSGNQSDVSFGGSAVVFAIASGSVGPPGPSGSAGFAFTNIYKRQNTVPVGVDYPVGNIPVSGWVLNIPDDTGEALWLSSGLISSADFRTLSGSWSTPTRLSGRVSYFSNDAPVSGSNSSPVIGDIWFDTNDGNKIYRWSGTAWVSVQDDNIGTLSSSLQQNITNTTNFSSSLASSIVSNSSSFTTSLNQTNTNVTNNSSSAAASISSVGAAVTTNSSSFAATISTLDTKVVNNSSSLASSITTVNGSVTTNSQSFALSINTLTSTVTTNSSSFASGLTTTNSTVATNSSSAATSITTLSSTVTNNSASSAASITTTATTLAAVSSSVVNIGAEYGIVVLTV